MAHFGPYTREGLTFDFAFHHVERIEVTAKNHCKDFCTREVILYDKNGRSLSIKCFSHESHELFVSVEPDEETYDNGDEYICSYSNGNGVEHFKCFADSKSHAQEQLVNAYPDAHSIYCERLFQQEK